MTQDKNIITVLQNLLDNTGALNLEERTAVEFAITALKDEEKIKTEHSDRLRRTRQGRDDVHDGSSDRALWEIAESVAAIADVVVSK